MKSQAKSTDRKCPRCGAEGLGTNPRTGKLMAHTKLVKDPGQHKSGDWFGYAPAQHAEVCTG